jgi:hypothetical protein
LKLISMARRANSIQELTPPHLRFHHHQVCDPFIVTLKTHGEKTRPSLNWPWVSSKVRLILREWQPVSPPEEQHDLRKRLSKSKIALLEEWLDEQYPKVLPKTKLGEAISCALNRWAVLPVYLEHHFVDTSNIR